MTLHHQPQQYIERLQEALSHLDSAKVSALTEKLQSMRGTDMKVFLAGNGGSAATASHAACDFSKTILKGGQSGLRALCINDNIPLMTAWGNDEGYEHIFSSQLKNLATQGDLFIPITASGNSENILHAIDVANKMNIETFGFLGFDGGKAKEILSDYLLVPIKDYGIVEDIHMMTIHAITDVLKQA